MEQDIRELFKTEVETGKRLPVSHRENFIEKLQKQFKKKTQFFKWLKIAAVVFISLTVGASIFYTKLVNISVPPMIVQIEAIEAEYLVNIEKEWESFLSIAEDEVLINRFKNKLEDLGSEYQEISIQFKKDTNNILVIESLVENLQTRLRILKDIQEHIKILNQNNEQYESTI